MWALKLQSLFIRWLKTNKIIFFKRAKEKAMMQPSGACQYLSGTCNFHLFTYLYSIMIVLLYKCSLLGHTFFLFSPSPFSWVTIWYLPLFDKAKDDDLGKLWMPFFNPYFDHCLPAEWGSTESCFFPYIRGMDFETTERRWCQAKAQTCPYFNAMERREKHI